MTTQPTRPTRPGNNGDGFGLQFDLSDRTLPPDLGQGIPDIPIWNTPPQTEPNECAQIHPSLGYLCDLNFQDPTSYAEPEYKVAINGCGVCVTMKTKGGATNTSTTFCYLLPACRPKEPPAAPPPEIPSYDWQLDYSNIPPLPYLPPAAPGERRTIRTMASRSERTISFGWHKEQVLVLLGGEEQEPYQNITASSTPEGGPISVIHAVGPGYFKAESNSPPVYIASTYTQYQVAIKSHSLSVYYYGEAEEFEWDYKKNNWGFVTKYRKSWVGTIYSSVNAAAANKVHWGVAGETIHRIRLQIDPPPKPSPALPSPQPPMDEKCCADIRKLIKMVQRIEKRVGTEEFPVSVPRSLLSDRGNEILKIESIPELITWLTKQIDSLVGQLPGEIDVEDIDPLTEGNQTKRLKFPTLSDLMLEVIGVCLNNKINNEIVLTTVLSVLTEIGSVKTTSIANYHAIQAVLDYLGPELKQKIEEVPLSFTPGETKLDRLLKPTKTKVKFFEFGGKTDLQDVLVDLKSFIAQWRSQNVRKINLTGNETGQVMNFIRDALAGLENNENPQQASDFSNFVEEAEAGFTSTSGISDPSNPYGRPYDQRPRIREIGDTSDEGTEG